MNGKGKQKEEKQIIKSFATWEGYRGSELEYE